MFNKPGDKLQSAALILFVIGVIASIVLGIVYCVKQAIAANGTFIIWAVLISASVVIGGILVSYLGGLVLYGFGELIESNARIEERMKPLYEIKDSVEALATDHIKETKRNQIKADGKDFSDTPSGHEMADNKQTNTHSLCKECNQPIAANARFCPKCGAKQD